MAEVRLMLVFLSFSAILEAMQRIERSERLKQMEEQFSLPLKELFYNWHWKDNLTHKAIASKVGLPRPTITRWFKKLGIPTQDCQRMTKRRWQIKLIKTLRIIEKQRRKPFEKPCLANKDFFKEWTPQMAYILGYFAADGCMFVNKRGAHFIDFTSTDRELIEKVRECLASKHLLAEHHKGKKYEKWKKTFRLQIGSKEMFNDLLRLGFTPRKSKTLKFPDVPDVYFADFVRGYFDGDGCVYYGFFRKPDRVNKSFAFALRFTSGSKDFLSELWRRLKNKANIRGGSLSVKDNNSAYDLQFSKNDTMCLFHFLYDDIKNDMFLKRKYHVFQKAFIVMKI